jgi:hypothetical protein
VTLSLNPSKLRTLFTEAGRGKTVTITVPASALIDALSLLAHESSYGALYEPGFSTSHRQLFGACLDLEDNG